MSVNKVNRSEPVEGLRLPEIPYERLKHLANCINRELRVRNQQKANVRHAKRAKREGRIGLLIATKLDPHRVSVQDRLAKLIDDQRRDQKYGDFSDARKR